jgi:hypothetical protein
MKTRRPTRVCQTRERVGDEGTSGVASTGHARGRDHHELVAMSEGLAEEASGSVAVADRRRDADAARGSRSRVAGGVDGDEAMTRATKSRRLET